MAAAAVAGEPEPVQQAQGGQLTEPDLTGPVGVEQDAVDLVGGEDLMVVEQLEQQAVAGGGVGIGGQQSTIAA
ncbi:hypothetical protein [Micromonospora sp. NPDC047738]|uniref:hypothetical protein n=1 Tax=unclassified Micromonospora TaxID=2617518 RepID=UPI0033D47AE7